MQSRYLFQQTRTAVALAIGAGALFAASTAHAVVVTSGIVNIPIPATTAGVYINVVTGANSPAPASAPGWDINPWSATGLGFFNPATPAGGVYVSTAAGVVANLPVGSLIDATDTFSNGLPANIAQWNLNSSNNYFGFRFTNESGGTLHYGWAQIEIGSAITSRTLVQYAFESTPNTGIAVVPEPGTYLMMGLGLAGLLAARRRQQQR
jgi:hypothetical protein